MITLSRKIDIDKEMSKVFTEITRNSAVTGQDIKELCSLGVPAFTIALSLVDGYKFMEKVSRWREENGEKEFAKID